MKRTSLSILLILFFTLFIAGCGGGGGNSGNSGTEYDSGPLEITDLTAMAGNEEVSLTWTETGDTGRVEITWNPDGTTAQSVEAGACAFTATELVLGTEYTFTVTSIDGNENTTAEFTATATPYIAGVPSNTVYISTIEGLKAIDDDTTGYYVLAADIDISGEAWSSLCAESGSGFTGTLDGNGHVIKGLTGITSTDNKQGLIAHIYTSGTVKNLGLEDVDITLGENNYSGALAGYNSGAISNCYSTGAISVTGSGAYTGGLVGYNLAGTINNSYSTCSVSGYNCVGGLVGTNVRDGEAVINNSYATGDVSGYARVGGLVGKSEQSIISNAYATGDVSGTGTGSYIGGLVGQNTDCPITGCSASGTVSGAHSVGGLAGENKDSSDTDSYDSTINYSYAAVPGVSGTGNYIGGLVGDNQNARINFCFAAISGDTAGATYVGGLVGRQTNTLSTAVEISNCYALCGNVTGSDYLGGLIGSNQSTTVSYCYATAIVQTNGNNGGLIGYDDSGAYDHSYFNGDNTDNSLGTATALSAMMSRVIYIDWDFNDIWSIDDSATNPINRGYPYLANLPPDS